MLQDSAEFKETRSIRDNITHNNPPLMLENPEKREKIVKTLSEGDYINSDVVKSNMDIFF
uniref:hypothetical protein n=1 Tax=Staphylococcus simulans TaxID=1286 RepID=UPI00155DDA34|nr:hypothetical protein [Staphylococcus simulans]